ncbi:MAG: M48 family metallopeptidase [Phycisphaerales bacterium]|nr:M48 family metallopeptidase [Phycisphaerales bacterium]
MDFFAAQDQAHRKTGRLVAMLITGLVAMTVAVYAAVMLIVHLTGGYLRQEDARGDVSRWVEQETQWWDPRVAFVVFGFMVIIVGGGYLYRWLQMRKGGDYVAEMLGGRLIDLDTRDPSERKALNVVEEMAIASGMPVPPVYMMPSDAINAFAAGHSVDQAVIGLTEGCVANLTRDELQGVVAHEFSHIFNGDMRLNIKLVSVISGVMALGITGYILWRYVGYALLFSSGGRSSSNGKGNNALPVALGVMLLGFLLCVIGFAGTLVARLIQAAVSRQREFLADASAVQYTRNPDGIAGALRRIGGLADAKTKLATETSQFNHMFFNQAMPSMFDSHPPLPIRIARIENIPVDQIGELKPKLTAEEASSRWDSGQSVRRAATGGGMGHMIGAVTAAAMADSLGSIGQVANVDVAWTRQMMSSIPERLATAAHAPDQVPALVLAMLLHEQGGGDAFIDKQLDQLEAAAPMAKQKIQVLLPHFAHLDERCRVPLLDLASPALSRLSVTQGSELRQLVERVVMADGAVSRFEWVAAMLIDTALDRGGDASHRPVASISSVSGATQTVLAVTVRAGHTDDGEALAALQRASAMLKIQAPASVPAVTLSQLNDAVHDLRTLRFCERGRLLEALVAAVQHDGQTTIAEAEMVRAVAEMLAVPMPPVVPDAA